MGRPEGQSRSKPLVAPLLADALPPVGCPQTHRRRRLVQGLTYNPDNNATTHRAKLSTSLRSTPQTNTQPSASKHFGATPPRGGGAVGGNPKGANHRQDTVPAKLEETTRCPRDCRGDRLVLADGGVWAHGRGVGAGQG